MAGDFNCRTDKPDRKALAVFETLEEEGFSLANQEQEPTYIVDMGKATHLAVSKHSERFSEMFRNTVSNHDTFTERQSAGWPVS
ncbi:hypothetical protein ANN_19336 [Periplaneta americana]|uniref:Uncharacterized protein n=1 Tax=Periplaneta americana TaxID=6978 RepID=A0ABQ8SA94_PERAM|nr:hypothetical protein ANN_19336 [Periplaneta americana]